MSEETKEKRKSRINLLVLILFASVLTLFFWTYIRPKIIITSCNEIALNTSNVKARTSLFIDTAENYEVALNKCLIEAGIEPPSE